ncbi:UNVERIFIED_ORG: hypothetical protein LHJ69_21900 [Shinella sp. XGS7]|nr:EF-hand domain-containing protein [Shinella sp. XGS7]
MSVISGLGGGASQAAWAETRAVSSGQNRRAQEMFARADVDGSGSVDASELQTVLDKFSERSGRSLGSAESQFSTLDRDGDGGLSSSELDSGLRSLLPPPTSTLEFAARQQQQGGPGGPGGGRPPPPPPSGEGEASQSLSAADQALDANGDGVVSMQERLGGQLKDLLQQVISASDSDGDGALSSSEAESLRSQFSSALDQALSGTASSSSSSSSDSSGASGSGSGSASSALDQLASLLLRRYGGVAEGGWQSRASLSLSA